MQVFITGTDTNIGKTLISSWIALHTKFAYFKPIQTGTREGMDSIEVSKLSGTKIYPEAYSYVEPLSPHLASSMVNDKIELEKIILPQRNNLIIEGAGGLLVPINKKYYIIDLIKFLKVPVILVCSSKLGTINHTLLSLEALKLREIKVLGVIMNGEDNIKNKQAIEFYGNTQVIAELPKLSVVNQEILKKIPLTEKIKNILM